jgi:hypothetical protein
MGSAKWSNRKLLTPLFSSHPTRQEKLECLLLYLASPRKLVIRRLRRSPTPRKQCVLSYRKKTKATITSIEDLTDEYNGGVCLPTAVTSAGA